MLWSLLFISLIALCNAGNATQLNGTTSQSSNYNYNQTPYSSERAFDGDLEQCAHTCETQNSWWRIDLLGVFTISSFRIYNKRAENTLTNAQICISNSCDNSHKFINSMCQNISNFTEQMWNNYSFTGVSGRYITVFCPTTFVILCEVQIFGTIKESPFMLIRENKTWEDALYHCRDQNMDLASIVCEETQAWAELEARNANTSFVWLGLRYTCTLDFWFWVNDQRFRFSQWAPNGEKKQCNMSGAMKKGNYSWSSKPDNNTFNFICAK